MNYKTESLGGFRLGTMSQGERFNNQEEPVKVNHLIFVLEGVVSVVKDGECMISVRDGEFVFIPISSLYEGTVIRPGRYLDLTFFHNNISLCDKYMLSHYLKDVADFDSGFTSMPVREPLDLFLKLMEIYLSSGVCCKHLHEIKEKELFIILRTAYTKDELVRLLHPIMGQRVDFRGEVLRHKDKVSGREELARLMGMSVADLARKFKEEFGETVYSWLLKQKNERIRTMLSQPSVTIKDVVYAFNFSSLASFNKYCKSHFGCSPRVLAERIKSEKPKEYVAG